MAEKKRKILDDPFASTTPPSAEQVQPEHQQPVSTRGRKRTRDYKPDDVAPIGVGLRFSEGEHLTQIAKELGTNRHDLLLYIVREWVTRYDAGWRPPTETKTVLKR